MKRPLQWARPLRDLTVTLLLWGYFTVGFVLLFAPFYAGAFLLARDRQTAFQGLNHRFYQTFFGLARWLIPGLRLQIPATVRSIRGAVVVCNHISYLDPILLISIFNRHTTIVKSTFFSVPIFNWMLKAAGYLPSSAQGPLAGLAIRRLEHLGSFLASGGVVFVFPEGTRSRDGRLGPFSKGAFRIARRCRVPVKIVRIRHTDRLFRPGTFLFNASEPVKIEMALLGSLPPEELEAAEGITAAMERARKMLATATQAK